MDTRHVAIGSRSTLAAVCPTLWRSHFYSPLKSFIISSSIEVRSADYLCVSRLLWPVCRLCSSHKKRRSPTLRRRLGERRRRRPHRCDRLWWTPSVFSSAVILRTTARRMSPCNLCSPVCTLRSTTSRCEDSVNCIAKAPPAMSTHWRLVLQVIRRKTAYSYIAAPNPSEDPPCLSPRVPCQPVVRFSRHRRPH